MHANRSFLPRPEQPLGYSTEVAAELLGVAPTTLRVSHSRLGHWGGITPRKLPNRMLSWPAREVEAVLRGEPVQPPESES